MSPRLPKSASPIHIAEPLHREIESNKRYCDLVVFTRYDENDFDIQRVEKCDRALSTATTISTNSALPLFWNYLTLSDGLLTVYEVP